MIDRLVKYVSETLNVTLKAREWREEERLPLFLRDGYAYFQAEIHGMEMLLMIDADDRELQPSVIGKHMEQIRGIWGGEVVYVREQVSAYQRNRLIKAGIQFIVPANQLYLPMLAIDLREYFRLRRKSVRSFSPAAQALLLSWIYRDGGINQEQTPTEMARILGYSKMTMSRAFREVDWALDEVFANDKDVKEKKKHLASRQLWDTFQVYWRNPVSRRYFLTRSDYKAEVGLRAGLTALSSYTMLAEAAHGVYAVSQSESKKLGPGRDVLVPDYPDVDTVEVEVWSYSPHLFENVGVKGAVDPLSLYLTLRENRDERVELALDELLGGIGW